MFLYELHAHSSPCSGGGSNITDHIDFLRKRGFSGMVITNHFYHGDTKIDRSLPWSDFVDAYAEDFERGKQAAKLVDFDLLFGIEEHIGDGKEILIYGITPDFLYRHPDFVHADLAAIVRMVHEEGGLVFQAHPYRERWYIAEPGLCEEYRLLDGIETVNGGNTPEENAKAVALAEEKGLRAISGSDAHDFHDAGRSGISSPVRLKTNADLVACLKKRSFRIL